MAHFLRWGVSVLLLVVVVIGYLYLSQLIKKEIIVQYTVGISVASKYQQRFGGRIPNSSVYHSKK